MLTNAVPLHKTEWPAISANSTLQALITWQLVKIFVNGNFGIPRDCALQTTRTGMAYFDPAGMYKSPRQYSDLLIAMPRKS